MRIRVIYFQDIFFFDEIEKNLYPSAIEKKTNLKKNYKQNTIKTMFDGFQTGWFVVFNAPQSVNKIKSNIKLKFRIK